MNIFSIVISCGFSFRIQPSANFRFPTALGWGVKNAHFPLRLPPLRLPFPGWNFLSQWRRKMFLITIIRTKLIVNWNTKIKLRKCRRAQTTNCTFKASTPRKSSHCDFTGGLVRGMLRRLSRVIYFIEMHFAIFNFLFQFHTPGECVLKINENWNYLWVSGGRTKSLGESAIKEGATRVHFVKGRKTVKSGAKVKGLKSHCRGKLTRFRKCCIRIQRKFTRYVGCSPFGILNWFDVTQSHGIFLRPLTNQNIEVFWI